MRDEDTLADRFTRTGVVRLDQAFTPGQATVIADAVWGYLDRRARIRFEEPATWPRTLHGVSFRGLRQHPAFVPLAGNQAVRSALDTVFGPGGWTPPGPGAQILLTFPSPGPWMLPAERWHMDCGFEAPTWPVPGIKLFAFFGDAEPGGGGTLLLSGSHRLVERQDPWLRSPYEVVARNHQAGTS